MCLAYAGGPVSAEMFRTVPFRLHSCIRISDSLTDGYSYFYAEVRCLKTLLDTLAEEEALPVLYLIDEIYRGTNNRERLIGSRAFIKEVVGRPGIGFLATHDLELSSLAEFSPLIRNFHFRDYVTDGKLQFDYRLLPGPSPTTNALRIMEMEGLPVETSPDEG
jgi:DNA mismatch repair ATPase MutS